MLKIPSRSSCFLFTAAMLAALVPGLAAAKDYFAYYGGNNLGAGAGISMGHFDSDTGILTTPKVIIESASPTYFIISGDHKHFYGTTDKTGAGKVSSYEIDGKTGGLKLLNSVESGGAGPCHLNFDNTGHYLAVANYDAGSLAVFALQPDGSIGARTFFDQHTGKGPNPDRQEAAHAHSVTFDPSNHFLLNCDLGLDKIMVYKFDEKTGAVTPNDPAFADTAPGYGPRHLLFSPDGKFVYVMNELLPFVTVYNWDGAKGTLSQFQTVRRLPAGVPTAKNTGAELAIDAAGKFLYATSRDIAEGTHDCVAVFSIDAPTGKLTTIQTVSTQKTPRYMMLDPTGKWLIVAHQDSNSVMVFAVDAKTGQLTPKGIPISTPTPECVQLLEAP